MSEPAQGTPLMRLLDEALELDPSARQRWFDALDEAHAALKPRLHALLARAAEVESRDFLGTLPTLPAAPHEALTGSGAPGDLVGPYRLERHLGSGGMGTVWLAKRADGLFERAIALKLPHRGWFGADLADRMSRERSILASLEHPHIARLYDAGIADDGQPFLALEYVEGLPIDEYCRAGQCDLPERLKLFLQVADAVAAAHARLIVHRDLKPANILVTREGDVRLLDFGVAKLLDSGGASPGGLTQLSVHALTPDYASPEQILDQPVTIATDVYSLGVVLYELLTGMKPYRLRRDTRGALEDAILQVEPPAPSSTGPQARALRGDLDTIVLKALRKNPEQRYATVNALAEDLRRHLAGRPVLAQADSAWYRASRFVRRNRMAVSVAALVSLALLGSTVAASIAFVRARSAEQRALAEAATSREVAHFLADLFNVSDPGESRGNSITAREMLDRASLRINNGLRTSPRIRAELQLTMANVYANLGLYAEALQLAEASLELRRREGMPLDVATGLEQIGHIHNSANRGPLAGPPIAEALALRRRHAPEDHAALARTLQLSGASRFLSADFATAMAALEQARAELAQVESPEPEQSGNLLRYIAYLHHERADYARAVPLYREALRVLEQGLGGDHPLVAGALGDLAIVLKDTQQFEEAERSYLAALAIQRRTLGDKHRDVGDSLNNLAILYMDQGDFAKGLATAGEGAALLRESLGVENDLTCIVRLNAARALTQLGRLDEAEREYREILLIRRRTLATDHLHTAVTIDALADLLNRRQKFAEALRFAREARGMLERTLEPGSWRIASNGRILGMALTGLEQFAEAEKILGASYRTLLEKRGPTHRTTLLTASRMASLYEAWGRPESMREWLAKSQPGD